MRTMTLALGVSALLFAAEAGAAPRRDLVLAKTLRPASGTRIDCGGGTLRPAVRSSRKHDGTLVPSRPEVLVLLDRVTGVVIENCTLEGADFGVYVVRGGAHVIRDNHIDARSAAVVFRSSSDNHVSGNRLASDLVGIWVRGDADRNRVWANEIVRKPGGGVGFVQPGFADVDTIGPGIVGAWTPYDAVTNIVVDGELIQILNNTDDAPYDAARHTDDLQIWDNRIDGRAGSDTLDDDFFVGVGLMGGSRDGTATGNVVRGGAYPAASFGYLGAPRVFPGWCSEDASRRCGPPEWDDFGQDDCFLPGVDKRPRGVCVGAILVDTEARVLNSRFLGNTLSDGDICLGGYLAPTSVFEGNETSRCRNGIEIGDYMYESGTVVANRSHDNGVGLYLFPGLAASFGATVERNDVVDNEVQLVAEQRYVRLAGNYWGRSACFGFQNEDAPFGHGADCAPYVESVAGGAGDAVVCAEETRPASLDGVCGFDVAAVVAAEGGTSVSFQAAFDYTGSYSAAGHGLVAPASSSGSVTQGEFVYHAIDVPAGTRHLRIRIEGSAPNDLDLALLDADGNFVTGSFTPLAVESVDLDLPAAGGYSVEVNGWFVEGDAADYRLDVWTVPGVGGNLSASGPSSVTRGTTETITASWPAGLAPGSYLGVIGHQSGTGFLRPTILEVHIP